MNKTKKSSLAQTPCASKKITKKSAWRKRPVELQLPQQQRGDKRRATLLLACER